MLKKTSLAAFAALATAAAAFAGPPEGSAPAAEAGAATGVGPRQSDAVSLVQACIGAPAMASYSEPEPACACGIGFVSARSTDRQFAIMARLARHANDQPAMQAAIQQMIAEGYTGEEIAASGQIMIDTSSAVDATCEGLQR